MQSRVSLMPHNPGVYIMKDKTHKVIYVGKAKDLKNRVSTYFNRVQNIKTTMLVSNIHDIDIIVTDTEFEALILENSLIKKHKPKYNILLKDDKSYPYIKITIKEDYPQISICNKPTDDGNKYFGPYGSRSLAFEAIKTIKGLFMLPNCKRKFPRDILKERPCIYAHIKKCSAVCDGSVSKQEFMLQINDAIDMLSGKFNASNLEKEMLVFAESLEFEKASILRDRIKIINSLGVRSNVLSGRFIDLDVIACTLDENRACVTVLHYIQGELKEKEYTILDSVYDSTEALSSFIKQYYIMRKYTPQTILINEKLEDTDILIEWLSKINNKKINIISPIKGERKKLIDLAISNSREELIRSKYKYRNKTLELLGEKLNMKEVPLRIEAYDISHISGSDMVGAMIVFKDGRPLKRDYRKFRLNNQVIDDASNIKEVITRRLERYKQGDEKFIELPDLFLIDGGINQTRAAKSVLDEYGIDIPVVGMVKDKRHKTRALILSGGTEVSLLPLLFTFIGKIQEEVHRFAISYHKNLRSKNLYNSELDNIPGVGEKTKEVLIKHFKTMDNIKLANIEELEKVLSKKIAEKVYNYFKEGKL